MGYADVAKVSIFVENEGKWEDNAGNRCMYRGCGKARIIEVPTKCSFHGLLDIVHKEYGLGSVPQVNMTYGCKTSIGIMVVQMTNDADVHRFLEFNLSKYLSTPLCLEISRDEPAAESNEQGNEPVNGCN